MEFVLINNLIFFNFCFRAEVTLSLSFSEWTKFSPEIQSSKSSAKLKKLSGPWSTRSANFVWIKRCRIWQFSLHRPGVASSFLRKVRFYAISSNMATFWGLTMLLKIRWRRMKWMRNWKHSRKRNSVNTNLCQNDVRFINKSKRE